MDLAERRYRESGRTPARGMLITFTFAATPAVLLAPVYALIVVYLPRLETDGLWAFGVILGSLAAYACAIAWAARRGVRRGKVRSRTMAVALTLAATTLGYYALWVAWVFAFFDWTVVLLRPTDILEVAVELSRVGTWAWGDDPVAGISLLIYWAFEALAIFGGPVAVVILTIPRGHFCEACDQWMRTTSHPFADDIRHPELLADIEQNTTLALSRLQASADNAGIWLCVQLTRCDNPEHPVYVGLQHAWPNEGKIEYTEILPPTVVSGEVVQCIEQAVQRVNEEEAAREAAQATESADEPAEHTARDE